MNKGDILRVEHLSKHYVDPGGRRVQAVTDVSLSIAEGEVLGLVGESGCGKSTLGRTLLCLNEADAGRIEFAGRQISGLPARRLKALRHDCQIIFQDPYSSLNPRHSVAAIVGEALVVHGIADKQQRRTQIERMLALVGLPADAAERYPHEFSGGQRQRIAIARALILQPRLLVADEAVSALDVSIQSQIINLLMQLQKKMRLSMLFISHDLSVVRHISHRIAVMYLGRIVELGDSESIMQQPQHPYTRALISAIPNPRISRAEKQAAGTVVLQGDIPDPASPPDGCAFHSRCRHALARCRNELPELLDRRFEKTETAVATHSGRKVACHLYPPA